jgi:hypothetical protein
LIGFALIGLAYLGKELLIPLSLFAGHCFTLADITKVVSLIATRVNLPRNKEASQQGCNENELKVYGRQVNDQTNTVADHDVGDEESGQRLTESIVGLRRATALRTR